MDRDRRSFILQASALAGLAVLGPRVSRAGAVVRRGVTLLDWTEIAEGVHACVDRWTGGNTVLFGAKGGALVSDAKFPFYGEAILRDTESVFGSIEGVELINTHHHGDHTGGNVAFKARGVPVIAHRNATDHIRGSYDVYIRDVTNGPSMVERVEHLKGRVGPVARELADRADALGIEDWVPDRQLGQETVLRVGDGAVEVRHFGAGHTDNDLVIHDTQRNVVHAGDLVFNKRNPYFFPSGGATLRGWVASLDKLLALCDSETVVVPGHGAVGGREIVGWQIEYMQKLEGAVRGMLERGVPRDEVVGASLPFMTELGSPGVVKRALGAVYDELAGG